MPRSRLIDNQVIKTEVEDEELSPPQSEFVQKVHQTRHKRKRHEASDNDGVMLVSEKREAKERKAQDPAQSEAEQFRPLLEQLRYGKVIKKISEIRKLTKADSIKKFGEEMILPRIIVIGNESSGKSSTLERIAGQPVLPCDTGICTRAPVVLELKYDPGMKQPEIYFKDFEGDYQRVKNAEDARIKVKASMDSLKSVGVSADKEVRVKIVSQDVPTLDLVDLPGIVLARNNNEANGEPEDISALTVGCAKKYLTSSDTAVVLCIVAASEPNLRTVKALGLLQECPNYEKLKHSAIGTNALLMMMMFIGTETLATQNRWRV